MSEIPRTQMLSRIGWRRKLVAFASVAAATFCCLSLFWPLSTKQWRSESDIVLQLTGRSDASKELESLVREVVPRLTSIDSIVSALNDNGMGVDVQGTTTRDIAQSVHQRLQVRIVNDQANRGSVSVRVGLLGEATEQQNYFVNLLATNIARDFMTSPLACIVPEETRSAPSSIATLQDRRKSIELRANELLDQIAANLKNAASDLPEVASNVANHNGNGDLPMLPVDSGNERQSSPFVMASHPMSRTPESGSHIEAAIDSLHESISELANVAADACNEAEWSFDSEPAFQIQRVEGKTAQPVGAVPGRKEFLFLMLASVAFASIVSLSYQPFYETGFEDVQQIEKQLQIPVIASLQKRNDAQESTESGLAGETVSSEASGSNQVVNICKWILFCGLMLTIGFCLVNADVREAFLDGPYHGFARIAWAVQGK